MIKRIKVAGRVYAYINFNGSLYRDFVRCGVVWWIVQGDSFD